MTKKILPISFALGFIVFFLAGCTAASHMEELNTLRAMGKEEKSKAQDTHDEDKNFQKIKAAITEGRLKPGMKAGEVSRQGGEPVVISPQENGEKWVYKPGNADWFSGPKISLYFNKSGLLKKWECRRDACEPS